MGDCVSLVVWASLDSPHEVAEVQHFSSGFKLHHEASYNPLIHPLIQITHEVVSNYKCLSPLLRCSPISSCTILPSLVLHQPVTATLWAPLPCSVTVTEPVSVARASWVTSVTNVSWITSTTEPHTNVRNARFATAWSRSRWVDYDSVCFRGRLSESTGSFEPASNRLLRK